MKMLGRGLVVLVLCTLTAAGGWFYALHGQKEEHQVLSPWWGFLMQIKADEPLGKYGVLYWYDYPYGEKGDWRRLWQDSQSGIFIVRGKVLAGLDLDKLGADNVNIVDDKVLISLPAVEILSVDLENIESVRYSDRLV